MTKEEWQAEVDATVKELPQTPPKGTVEYLISVGKLSRNALVWRVKDRRKGLAEVHCTACGHSDEMEYVGAKQGYREPHLLDWRGQVVGIYSDVRCPVCGAFMQNKHHVQGGCEEIDSAYCVSVHNVRGHLCLLEWQVRKFVDWDGNVTYDAHQWEGVLLAGGKMVSVRGYQRYMNSMAYFTKWEARQRFVDGIEETAHVLPFRDSTIWRSEAEKSALEVYLRWGIEKKEIIYPGYYLRLWSKHKNAENLVRAGLSRYVSEVIREHTEQHWYSQKHSFHVDMTKEKINWKEVKPNRMLGLDKDELEIARKCGMDGTEFYKTVRDKEGVRLAAEEINMARALGFKGLTDLIDKKYPGVRKRTDKVIRYLAMQNRTSRQRAYVHELEDCWSMAREVYGRIPEPWPKELMVMHDRMMLLKKEKTEKKIDEGIRAQAAAFAWARFEDEETRLLIRHVADQTEIIKEGEFLHHCVGTYAKRVSEGETHIFVIRRAEEPEIPFFTLEWDGKSVRQNRGLRNCERTPEVRAFEEKWISFINKEEKKHGTDGKTDAA